jgi:hypothetical protein
MTRSKISPLSSLESRRQRLGHLPIVETTVKHGEKPLPQIFNVIFVRQMNFSHSHLLQFACACACCCSICSDANTALR